MNKTRRPFSHALLLCAMRLPVAACLAASVPEGATSNPADTTTAYSCILHVHTATSSGRYSLPELTDVARRYGVDAIFLSDSLSASVQYGIPPLRHVFWASRSLPSVRSLGPSRYLAEIADENRRQSEVLYVPGVEICPRYYWTGSLMRGNLTCHDLQKNLIALGAGDPDLLAGIPEVAGYAPGRRISWMILTRLLPAVFIAASGVLLFGRNARTRRLLLFRAVLPLLSAIVLLNAAASLNPLFAIYGQKNGDQAGQRVIDYLEQRGIPHYWAHPEESDRNEVVVLGRKIGVRTDPYPEMPAATRGHTGFGGVYEGRNTLVEPGSTWDVILNEYAKGKRAAPAWCFGEMLYHYEGQAGKRLGNVETMVWAERKTAESLLASIRRGRFYARRNTDAQSLSIGQWSVGETAQTGTGSDTKAGTPPAESGGTLESETGAVEAALEISSALPGEQVSVRVLRDGTPIRMESATTPFRLVIADTLPPDYALHYYRAIVNGKHPLALVTNPVFAKRR